MPIVVDVEPRIQGIEVTNEVIIARLVDGRVVSIPIEWSWRLAEASPSERENFRVAADGSSVHWPDLDEDLSAEGMLTGSPAPRPSNVSSPESSPRRLRLTRKKAAHRARRKAGP